MDPRDGTGPVRVGLIGCGGIGALRAAAMMQSAAVRLTAVSDIDAQKTHRLAHETGSVMAADWHALVERPDVDAVVVSTPPMLHAEMVIAALRAGKHVLCEKPLGRTPAECRSMLAAAEEAGPGIVFATGFNYRFYPSFARAREMLRSGLIGALDHVRSYAGYSATDHGQAWVHDAAVVGGGALWDNGIHLIDLTRHYLGEVEDVVGIATNRVWRFPGCEDNGAALLRGASGGFATLHASWTEWKGYRFQVELYGTLGMIRASCFPMLLDARWSGEVGGRMRRSLDLFPRVAVMEKARGYQWVVGQSFVKEFDAFGAAIAGRLAPGSALATGLDGTRAIEIAAEAAGAGESWKGS